MIFPKQLYVQLNHLGGHTADTLRIGRFEFLDGGELTAMNGTRTELHRDRINARLIGNFGFTEVGRSMDGVSYSHAANGGTFALAAERSSPGRSATPGAPRRSGSRWPTCMT